MKWNSFFQSKNEHTPMSCRICGRSSCTESFHSLEEQELFAQRKSMPDDVDLLRRMVQEGAREIVELKSEVERLQAELREKSGFVQTDGR